VASRRLHNSDQSGGRNGIERVLVFLIRRYGSCPSFGRRLRRRDMTRILLWSFALRQYSNIRLLILVELRVSVSDIPTSVSSGFQGVTHDRL